MDSEPQQVADRMEAVPRLLLALIALCLCYGSWEIILHITGSKWVAMAALVAIVFGCLASMGPRRLRRLQVRICLVALTVGCCYCVGHVLELGRLI